jgi:amino acid transporter
MISEIETPPPQAGALHRQLTAFGALLLTLSCLSPVLSIYGIGSDVLQHQGTGAAPLFLIGIGAAVVWAVVYAEVGSAYPYAGGDYVGVGRILGSWAGFASLTAWVVTAGPSTAYEVQIFAQYMGELWPGVPTWAWVVGGLVAALAVAMLAVRASAIVTGIFLAIEMAAVLVLIVAGAMHPHLATALHPVVMNAHGVLAPVGVTAMALGFISAAYATAGGNQAINFGEELEEPHKHMGKVVLWAALIGAFGTALPVIGVVVGAKDLVAVMKDHAPFARFASDAFGPWAGPALSGAVALAVFNALIAQLMFLGRLYFSLGRDKIFPGPVSRVLSWVEPKSGAPRGGTLVIGVYTAACCFLNQHLLLIFSSGIVISSLGLVSLAVLVGRRKGLTGGPGFWKSWLWPLAPVLGLLLTAIFFIADLFDADAGRPSVLLLAGVIALAMAWYAFVLRKRPGGWAPSLG